MFTAGRWVVQTIIDNFRLTPQRKGPARSPRRGDADRDCRD
jgi:hypothetical protein